MSKILRIARMDLAHLRGNVIALVVCVGMIVVPSFYAWFNTAGFWDPYGNTANLRVAVANSDEGYSSDLIPIEVNIGDRTASQLLESESIGYELTDEDEAREGVASGEYYAAIIIPKDFSRRMLTGLLGTGSGERPTVEYVSNQKRNAIANIVTEKASTSVSQTIDETFVSSAVEVGASVLDEVGDYLDDEHLAGVVSNLDDALGTSTDELRRTATNLRSYAALVGSVDTLSANADTTLREALDSTSGIGDTLRQTSSGVRDLNSGLGSATSSLDDAFSHASSSYDGVERSIDDAFSQAGTTADDIAAKLTEVKGVVDGQYAELSKWYAELDGDRVQLLAHQNSFDVGTVEFRYSHTLYLTVAHVQKDASTMLDHLKALSDGLGQTTSDLQSGRATATEAHETLRSLVADARESLSGVHADYEGGLGSSLGELSSRIDEAAGTADSLLAQLGDTSAQLSSTVSDTSEDLGELRDTLETAAGTLETAADTLGDTRDDLSSALDSGDLDQVRAILSASPTELGAFISEPIQLNRNAVYAVANNGSAMAPFYSTLSIWIGAVILCALVLTMPSSEALRRIGAKPHHAYLGRLLFFVCIGLLQTVLIVCGDLFFLQIQCVHPWLFLLCSLVASVVFVNLVFSLTASFGDVGKAIAVLLMVLQVAGSGGSFPLEMLPRAFQAVYPFLPFVQAEACMRAAIAGLYGMDFWVSLAKLVAFLVPSLVLGLLLRRPVIRLNHWFERQLERTKVM